MLAKRICVGAILKPTGVRGLVKIKAYTDSPDTLVGFSELFLEDGSRIKLISPKVFKNGSITSAIEGYSDRTSVEKLHSKELFVNRTELKELDEGVYYIEDLRGLTVLDQNNVSIGKVTGACNYGAGTFLEVDLKGKEATIPFHEMTILEVNLTEETIKVDSTLLLI